MKIAVLVGGIIYDSQRELIYGINDLAKEKGAKVFVFTCGGDIYSANDHSRGEFQIYKLPDLEMFDGVIIAPNTIQNAQVVEELEKKLSEVDVPVIVIDAKMGELCSFSVDNEKAIYDMTEHVICNHGKKKILYLSGPTENWESLQRLSGFLKCVTAYQFSEKTDYRILYGDFWTDSGYSLMKECFEKFGVPEAVICANDYMAIGALESINNAGYQCPEDVLVTGFDNSIDGQHHLPRLSTIEKPLYEIGKEACARLIEQDIQKKTYHFPVKMIWSESCGCCSEQELDIQGFKSRMIKEKNTNIRWAEVLNSMSADLNEISSFEEFISKIKVYVKRLEFPYFYLCLCEEEQLYGKLKQVGELYKLENEGVTDYTEQVKVAIAYEDGKFLEQEIISSKELLSKRVFEKENSIFSVVLPIHFRLHCMGYCVVGNSMFPLETIQFQSWIMNLGNGLENIRKQMVMQDMINQLNKMWIYDTMTGVLNRAGFYNKANRLIQDCKEQREQILLLFIDADGLKSVNDTYGHEEGDFYIKSIAKACQQALGEEGTVMRYGGDEFVVLKKSMGHSDCQSVIKRIKECMKQMQQEAEKPYIMDISIGSYVSVVDEEFRLEKIVEQADKDMYAMKKKKRAEKEIRNGK